ncbi:ADP-ribosylglycohydrolase family protein [Zoogloea sp.]|uniref:ADP-ribosylglycohydrolase family protein n=1 Tax=Zoogloea sp. TaxID=49181 RepID=UPI0026021C37|nr:ADP-ribosylglycohydrolase family protein [Zoogloea sp.]MDD3353590.1 ADP-ribosylglycohydrolase family protein [Zoogloea sp.]
MTTHDHPEGLKGAEATALAIFLARMDMPADAIREAITERYGYNLERSPDEIRVAYVFNETCQETVPQALVCALTATDFEGAIRNAISIGGDSDTVGAIAGGLAEAGVFQRMGKAQAVQCAEAPQEGNDDRPDPRAFAITGPNLVDVHQPA